MGQSEMDFRPPLSLSQCPLSVCVCVRAYVSVYRGELSGRPHASSEARVPVYVS